MALLAQFLGAEEVARMSDVQIERTVEILHAEMLRQALTNPEARENLTRLAGGVAREAAVLSRGTPTIGKGQ